MKPVEDRFEQITHPFSTGETSDKKSGVLELELNHYRDGTTQEKELFVRDFFRGLKEFGFVTIKNHPISLELLNKAYELSAQLFQLPESEKKALISAQAPGQRGYTPFGREHAKNAVVPDLKEFWHVGREMSKLDVNLEYPKNIWPKQLVEFRQVFNELYLALDEVGQTLLEALTGPLKLDLGYFRKISSSGNSILRLLHYPPIPEGVDPRCIRAAAHEDINLITILVSASASGLELLDRNGEWMPVETDANNLIVDSGDMLSRLTNDVIPSTTHRVVNPRGKNQSRYSMPFFLHPNSDALLECLESCRGDQIRYEPITADAFLKQRLAEIGLA